MRDAPGPEPITLSVTLKNVQDELNLAREEALRNALAAKEAEQRKNDLIVYLAHDLKTPLTSVLGYLTLLRDEPPISPELRAKYTGIALDRAGRLRVRPVVQFSHHTPPERTVAKQHQTRYGTCIQPAARSIRRKARTMSATTTTSPISHRKARRYHRSVKDHRVQRKFSASWSAHSLMARPRAGSSVRQTRAALRPMRT